MENDYIIVQAGGKGTRLKELTINKPKAIVSVNNLPIIFHLFKKYPKKKFVIIGDYKYDVFEKYLDAFSEVQFVMVNANGKEGTCSGIKEALSIIPPDSQFMLIWSDLILGDDFVIPEEKGNYIGLSESFPCRWKYSDGKLTEEASSECGVAGLFIFESKSVIENVPESGEFVRWLSLNNIHFSKISVGKTCEYGILEMVKKQTTGKCRPFNSMSIVGNKIIKRGIDEQGLKLAVREKAWYQHVSSMNVPVPMIYSYEPLTMELIEGKNVYEYDYDHEKKREILLKIMDGIKQLHEEDKCFPDRFSIMETYYYKTVSRLSKVRDLIPFANDPVVMVNGKKCRNIFFHLNEVKEKIKKIQCNNFCLIHGDCTFSNIVLKNGNDPIFIDPRGYFGNSEIVGDPLYDWSKLYYSLFGDYDQFNNGNFKLSINEQSVELKIESNNWKDLEGEFIQKLPEDIKINDVRFIHSLIWLSLTTYAWNDYDSICGSFYNGLYYLEDIL